MKTSATVLVLLALLLLIPCTQSLAQVQPMPQTPVVSQADFLASLAVDPAPAATDAVGAVKVCSSDAQCGPGQLCCYPCGRIGCTKVCTSIPPGGHCPLLP